LTIEERGTVHTSINIRDKTPKVIVEPIRDSNTGPLRNTSANKNGRAAAPEKGQPSNTLTATTRTRRPVRTLEGFEREIAKASVMQYMENVDGRNAESILHVSHEIGIR
jgi:hypothetical protein